MLLKSWFRSPTWLSLRSNELQTPFRPYVKFTFWVNAFCLIFPQMPSITFVFLMSEWRMRDSTVFLLVLIHKTMKGQPLHKVENTTATWTTMAESTGFLLVIFQSQFIVMFIGKLFILGQGTICVPRISPVKFFCRLWNMIRRFEAWCLCFAGWWISWPQQHRVMVSSLIQPQQKILFLLLHQHHLM